MSFTKTWLFQNKFIGSHIETYSHLLLSGGKVNVPQEEYKTMCKYYAQDVIEGNVNYITEMRTPVFRFHMDIDLLEESSLDLNTILDYCKSIQECIKQFVSWKNKKGAKKMMMIISVSPEQVKNKNNKDYIKYGIHLNWPYLKVDTFMASVLREGCIQYLNQCYGERHENNKWNDVIDKTVYTNNGLRWIYSDKAIVCPECKGKKTRTRRPEDHSICCMCQDSGKIPSNRIYEPIAIFDENNEKMQEELELITKKSFHHVVKCVELLSIKCFDKQPNIEIKEPFPKWYKVINVVLKTKHDKSRKHEANPIVKDNLSETGEIKKAFSILEQIHEDDKRHEYIIEYMQNFLPEEYADIHIVEILFCGKRNSKFRSYIVRTDSKFCQNLQDEHYSNHVYFIITNEVMHQRCFCRCDVVRSSGIKCCDYIDKGKKITSKLREILFPETIEKLKEKKEQIMYNPNKHIQERPFENIMEQYAKFF